MFRKTYCSFRCRISLPFVRCDGKRQEWICGISCLKMAVSTGLHYPVPCHLQKAYQHLGHKKGDFPNSEFLADHCVSLPIFAELTEEEINHVVEVINNYQPNS